MEVFMHDHGKHARAGLIPILASMALCFLLSMEAAADVEYGLAAGYPHDIGIEAHGSVVFTENFEEGSLDDMLGRWEDVSGSEVMSFDADLPAESGGSQSLFLSSGGHLYTRLLPGYDRIHVRFYARFDPSCSNVHHFVHVGGYNPTSPWPQGNAGIRPDGDERWSTGIEPMGESWAWDFYTYWMHMRSNPGGSYWGNVFSGKPSPFAARRGEWTCVEVMIRMNDPVDAQNGEQAFWIDGELKNHLGQGFPRGEWIWDGFWPDPTCEPSGPCDIEGSATPCCTDFEGFRWRTTTDLDINYLWLLHYVDADAGCEVRFDDVVVATEYIGPMVGDEPPDPSPDPVDRVEPLPDAAVDPVPDAPPADMPSDGPAPDVPPSDTGGEEDGAGDGGSGCGCSLAR
jgi:hypothetical protein